MESPNLVSAQTREFPVVDLAMFVCVCLYDGVGSLCSEKVVLWGCEGWCLYFDLFGRGYL